MKYEHNRFKVNLSNWLFLYLNFETFKIKTENFVFVLKYFWDWYVLTDTISLRYLFTADDRNKKKGDKWYF